MGNLTKEVSITDREREREREKGERDNAGKETSVLDIGRVCSRRNVRNQRIGSGRREAKRY